MEKIDIGLPVSVARMLIQNIRMMVPEDSLLIRRVQEKEVEPHSLNVDEIPDLTTTHQISIMRNRDQMTLSGFYESYQKLLPKMRSDVAEAGFGDNIGIFSLVCIVPLVIIYNRRISNPPSSWKDLLDPRWKGRIHVPSPDILRKLVTFYAQTLFGSEADKFFSNLVFDGLPIDVNQSVNDGSFDIGIVSLPFSRSSRDGNVCLCWPEEGALCLPQVLIHKRGADGDSLTVSRYLLSDDAQRYISDVGVMVPVNPDVPLPYEVEEHGMKLYWKGWDWFIAGITRV